MFCDSCKENKPLTTDKGDGLRWCKQCLEQGETMKNLKKFFSRFYGNRCKNCQFLEVEKLSSESKTKGFLLSEGGTVFSARHYCKLDNQTISEDTVDENARVCGCQKLLERTSPCFWICYIGAFLILSGLISIFIYDLLYFKKIPFWGDLIVCSGFIMAGPALLIKAYLLHKEGEI